MLQSDENRRPASEGEPGKMADDKWITHQLSPDMSLHSAALKVLTVRLETVNERLPDALEHGHEDPEHIHQLRVATRRCDAAFRIFRPVMKRKVYHRGRDRLRLIRRVAGAARDWDVFMMALRERSHEVQPEEVPGIDFLLAYSLGQRHAAQDPLENVEPEAGDGFSVFLTGIMREIGRINKGENLTLGEHAKTIYHTLLDRLTAASTGNLSDYAHLHQVRIHGKRLRYAIEILADCFDPRIKKDLYPRLEEMQDILGIANDSHVAIYRLTHIRAHLQSWPEVWERHRTGIEALLKMHQRRMPQQRRRFLKVWKQWEQMDPRQGV